MTPTLRPGDRLLVDHRRRPAVGDLVVGSFTDGSLVVKRVGEEREHRGRPAWYVVSDNPAAPNAMDSAARGPIPEDRLRGVVRARFWPRPRLFRTP